MKKIIRSGVLAICATLGAGGVGAADPIILKVAHFWPPTAMSQQKVLEPWCAKIEKDSAGRMECQIYPAMQLGGTPPQLIQQVQDGVADIVWTLPGYTAGRYPSMEVFELPFMTNRAEPASRAAWHYYEQFGKEDFAKVKPLAFHVHDEGYVHNNKHPITKLSDFRGLKMRAPTRLTNKMIAAFGATPVAMPLPAVAEAVSKGVVDGYVLPWEVIPAVKLHEMTKYHSETDKSQPSLYTALFIVAMNPAKYDSLPDDLKKVIDANSGADFSASIGKAWDVSAPPAREKAVEHGNQFAMISADELAKWRKVTDKLAAGWVKEMDGKGYQGQAMLDTAKSLIQKYNAQ